VKPDAIEPVRGMPKFDIASVVMLFSFKVLEIAVANAAIETSNLSQFIEAICWY
jgi:hypothetical protein